MDITKSNIKDELFAAMLPYVERLRAPDVIAATDAAKAAGVIKALYEKCVEGEPPRIEGPALGRGEIIEIIRSVMAAPSARPLECGATAPEGGLAALLLSSCVPSEGVSGATGRESKKPIRAEEME